MAAYLGFDWLSILNHLEAKEPDVSVRTNDINDMIAIYAVRGTKLEKIVKKMNPEGVKRVEAAKVKYGIKENAENPSDVTLGRIAAIFPQVMIGLLEAGITVPLGKKPAGLPVYYACNQGPCLMENDDFKEEWQVWFQNNNKVLNGKKAQMSDEKSESWYFIFKNSEVIPMVMRAAILKKTLDNARKIKTSQASSTTTVPVTKTPVNPQTSQAILQATNAQLQALAQPQAQSTSTQGSLMTGSGGNLTTVGKKTGGTKS